MPDALSSCTRILLFAAGEPSRTMNTVFSNPAVSYAELLIVVVPVAVGASTVTLTSSRNIRLHLGRLDLPFGRLGRRLLVALERHGARRRASLFERRLQRLHLFLERGQVLVRAADL